MSKEIIIRVQVAAPPEAKKAVSTGYGRQEKSPTDATEKQVSIALAWAHGSIRGKQAGNMLGLKGYKGVLARALAKHIIDNEK